jgi:hypothetical protein
MTTATIETIAPPIELEPDNSTRLAIYDAMCDARADGADEVTFDEFFDRVIRRLRVLVPRELHNAGERTYLQEKLAICVEAGILVAPGDDRFTLAPDPQAWIRFPDESIRRYPHGLSAARERLDAINATLRDRAFDITNHLPHHKASSPEFQALVRSMQEHGFFKHAAIYRFADGTFVDGVARFEAAKRAGVEPKYLELRQQDPETTRLRRRDTPLERVLLAVNGNAVRLTEDEQRHALDAAATTAGRTWDEIELYLAVTREWRSVIARSYTSVFEVTEVPFDSDGNRTIPVSDDHKVHVTTLLLASGLQKHKWPKELQVYVPTAEMARYKGGGPAGHFAPAADMLSGIELMLEDRREQKLKISPEWSICIDWLEGYVRKHRLTADAS